MAEMRTEIVPGQAADGAPCLFVGGTAVDAVAGLAAAAPHLLDPASAAEAAVAVNHLAGGGLYQVIEDPARYAAWYRARAARETLDGPADAAQPALGDAAAPDLDAIEAPRMADGRLVFFAVIRLLGQPYRVEVPVDARGFGEPAYAPAAIRPG